MKKSFYKYLFALFIGCFLVGCNHDEDTLSIIDESTDSVLAAAPDYEYRTILYLNICDEEKNSLLTLDGKTPIKQVHIKYDYNKEMLSNHIFFKETYMRDVNPTDAYYTIGYYDALEYVKATEIKGKYFYTHVENPNPKFLYGCLEASFHQYPIFSILSYLPEITNKYVSLKKNSLLLGLPLNFYYDENKEATMFVTWEKENGTVSTDKITCKWQFEENVDFLHGFEDIRTYKQFLRPVQIYVNDELMWDINNYQVLDSDSKEDKVAKNQITLYPYIELTK